MLISDSYSDKTSSTLPVIVSFSSHLKTKKIQKIRDFLRNHPHCQKYVTKGPNFVADGINEFRLYYVDSSLYADEITLKRLNVEKEEIVFRSTSEDSLEPSYNYSFKKKELPFFNSDENLVPNVAINKRIKKTDRATICTQNSYIDSRCFMSEAETPRVINKVSKSFQIGPDLRFNVVYVNTDVKYHSFNYKTAEASVQTEQIKNETIECKSSDTTFNFYADSSLKFPIRGSPSFILGSQRKPDKPEKKKLTTFKTFCSKMEEKRAVCKFTDDSEFNIESKTTSVKFSIKKSPSFVANYILEILNSKKSDRDILKSEIFEQSIVNYIKLDDFKKRVGAKKIYEMEMKNDIVKYERKKLKYDKKAQNKDEDKRNKHEQHLHRKKGERKKHHNKHPTNCYRVDKLRRYHNIGRSACCKVECLFKCTNMDFFLRRSHYAILKKYHRKLQENRHKREKNHEHRHAKTDRKQTEDRPNKNNYYNTRKFNNQNQKFVVHNCHEIPNHRRSPVGDSNTRTTISGFLQSYRPWHWQDNSKLSVCINEECFTEENLKEENIHINTPPYQCKFSKIRKYLNLH